MAYSCMVRSDIYIQSSALHFRLGIIYLFVVLRFQTSYNNACHVTLSVYPHRESLKNMTGHGGNRTYDLWNNGHAGIFFKLARCGYTLRVT